MRTSRSSSIVTNARNPSHLGSNTHSGPSGTWVDHEASIGESVTGNSLPAGRTNAQGTGEFRANHFGRSPNAHCSIPVELAGSAGGGPRTGRVRRGGVAGARCSGHVVDRAADVHVPPVRDRG